MDRGTTWGPMDRPKGTPRRTTGELLGTAWELPGEPGNCHGPTKFPLISPSKSSSGGKAPESKRKSLPLRAEEEKSSSGGKVFLFESKRKLLPSSSSSRRGGRGWWPGMLLPPRKAPCREGRHGTYTRRRRTPHQPPGLINGRSRFILRSLSLRKFPRSRRRLGCW